MKRLSLIFLPVFAVLLLSCGEKPLSLTEVNSPEIKLPADIQELIGDSAQVIIYSNGKMMAKGTASDIKNQKDFFILNLPVGEQMIELFITGPNENVVYMLDRKKVNIIPDVKNSLDMEIAPPLKFDTRIINLTLNDEVIVTAKIDSSRLPEGLKNPELKWTIDNIEGGNNEIGLITSNGNSATIRGPSALPSGQNHYLGAYYEADGRKYLAVIKINYIE